MKGVLDPHHTVPASKEKILELFDIVLCPVIGHIVDHDLEYPVEHPAGNDVAELIVQLWDVPALSAVVRGLSRLRRPCLLTISYKI